MPSDARGRILRCFCESAGLCGARSHFRAHANAFRRRAGLPDEPRWVWSPGPPSLEARPGVWKTTGCRSSPEGSLSETNRPRKPLAPGCRRCHEIRGRRAGRRFDPGPPPHRVLEAPFPRAGTVRGERAGALPSAAGAMVGNNAHRDFRAFSGRTVVAPRARSWSRFAPRDVQPTATTGKSEVKGRPVAGREQGRSCRGFGVLALATSIRPFKTRRDRGENQKAGDTAHPFLPVTNRARGRRNGSTPATMLFTTGNGRRQGATDPGVSCGLKRWWTSRISLRRRPCGPRRPRLP
jgi:hypothetical protein